MTVEFGDGRDRLKREVSVLHMCLMYQYTNASSLLDRGSAWCTILGPMHHSTRHQIIPSHVSNLDSSFVEKRRQPASIYPTWVAATYGQLGHCRVSTVRRWRALVMDAKY